MVRRETGFPAASSVEMFEDQFEKFDLVEVECVVGWLVLGSTRRTRSLFENVAEDRAQEVCLKSDIIFVFFQTELLHFSFVSVDLEWTIAEQSSHCPRSGGLT